VFDKWDLHAVRVGTVTPDGLLRVRQNGEVKAELPAQLLVLGGDAPVYERETRRPAYLDQTRAFNPDTLPLPTDYTLVLKQLLNTPNIASKHSVYRQYDHMVQIGTMVEPGSDAAVIRVPHSNKALAMCTDCNGRHVWLDPYEGTKGAVAEAARNVVCAGARPLAITNCLNFGNPYKPEVYWTFVEAIRGMGDACRAFGTPVTGGNVSFYNENPTGAIYPTPTIGMLGLLNNRSKALSQEFKQEGDVILLLGGPCNEVGGSEYLKTIHGTVAGMPPQVDLAAEMRLYDAFLEIADRQLARSAHDCSDGGLAVALAECCFRHDGSVMGAAVELPDVPRADFELFGESHGRIVATALEMDVPALVQICESHDVPVRVIGRVGGSNLTVKGLIDTDAGELRLLWEHGL